MKAPLLTAALLAALVACAPALTTPTTGRIVNASTAQEGTVTFTRGSLTARAGAATGPDNARLSIGGQTYVGRTVLVDSAGLVVPASGWTLGFNFGSGSNGSHWGLGTRFGPSAPQAAALTHSGNLIARTTTAPTLTLTCTLTVDDHEHGYGECTGHDGVKYALQF